MHGREADEGMHPACVAATEPPRTWTRTNTTPDERMP